MSPQRSEQGKDPGRSQKGLERGRSRTSNDPRGMERPRHQEQSTDDDFEDDEKDAE